MSTTNSNSNPKRPNNMPPGKKPPAGKGFNGYWIYGLILVLILAFSIFRTASSGIESNQSNLYKILQQKDVRTTATDDPQSGIVVVRNTDEARVYLNKDSLAAKAAFYQTFLKQNEYEALKRSPNPRIDFSIANVETFSKQLEDYYKENPAGQKIMPSYTRESDWMSSLLSTLVPILLVVGLFTLMMRKAGGGAAGGGPGGIFSIGKSRAQLFDKGQKVNITFSDVAGLDEAKVEVMEIVDFLKNPKKYTNLGGKIPKGALLVGPPGTGKTLLAKAVAGEAQVPFFSLSGSDFVEMFVGVGASRVRDLFKQAREKAPCIIFIDEIDAIGRARGKNVMMSNDERENTLNQLLVEMDGFGTDLGIIILAATNRADVLDSALMRPGRFDRQISIDRPDLAGREAIFKVHLKPIKSSKDLNIHKLAEQTAGFAGADIANVCNEAALIAARNNKPQVDMQDFQDAIDRIIGGLEKKNKIISPEEKRIIAYHEAGHAVCGWFLEHAHPLLKVTIVPRGTAALGYAQYTPKDQYIYDTEQLMDEMCMTLGGRASEEIFFGKISTGAGNDLQQITRIAYNMITVYGMNEKIGNISFYDPQQENQFTKPFSEETGKLIDEEVRMLIDKAYQRTLQLLRDKKAEVDLIAQELLKREVLFKSDVEELIGKRPYEKEDHTIDLEANKEVVTPTDDVTPTTTVTNNPSLVNEALSNNNGENIPHSENANIATV